MALIFLTGSSINGQSLARDTEIKPATAEAPSMLTPFRLPLPLPGTPVEYIDLDRDGDPDLLRTYVNGNLPVQWIDDDDDMREGDLEGDMDNDCLMVDRNRDGEYGSGLDLIFDWDDEDGDGDPDIQVVVDYPEKGEQRRFFGHYMWIIDTDNDQVFNYVDWNTLQIEAWEHAGRCHFFEDYMGQSIMLKAHCSTANINDVRYSWENPFLFFDHDGDGLTEAAVRLTDTPVMKVNDGPREESGVVAPKPRSYSLDGVIDMAYLTFDLDNDNGPGNEFDYDMSLMLSGGGFDYRDQVHQFRNLRGLPGTEHLFLDPRWRNLSELVFTNHDSAYPLVFKRGKWDKCWFVYDEDDDCQRWERVELYAPLDPFLSGSHGNGLDHNPQADVSGDRGEWDLDFSGGGNLYVGPFDGRIHLYGAEWGCWRVDQNARYFQGWQGWRGPNLQPEDFITDEPEIFPTVLYSDLDSNGYFDHIEYDLNGDQVFEMRFDLGSLGVSDTAALIRLAEMEYQGMNALYTHVAEGQWEMAGQATRVARKYNLNTGWYSNLKHPRSLREKYHYGYWLRLYICLDLMRLAEIREDPDFMNQVKRAFVSGKWDDL